MPEKNKYIDGVPVEGVADELPPEDRGGADSTSGCSFAATGVSTPT